MKNYSWTFFIYIFFFIVNLCKLDAQLPDTLAVIPFQVFGETEYSDFLKYGFPDGIAYYLNQCDNITLVSRIKLAEVLKEHSLNQTGLFDTGKTKNIGKLIAANGIISGSVYKSKQKYRVNIQFINVRTAEVILDLSDDVELNDYSDILDYQEELAKKISYNINLTIKESDNKKITASHEVYTHYLKALSHLYNGNSIEAQAEIKLINQIDKEFFLAHILQEELNVVFKDIKEKAQTLADRLIANMPHNTNKPFRIVISSLTYKNLRFSSPFLFYFQEKVISNLDNSEIFKIIKGNELSQLIRTRSLDVSEKTIPDSPEGIKFCTNAHGILTGEYREDENTVFVDLKVIENNSLSALSTASVSITKKNIPSGLPVLPENYNKIKNSVSLIADNATTDSPLKVKLWLDRLDGGVYRVGESVKVYVWANKECYIKLVYHDVAGNDLLIFPNTHSKTNRINSNRVYEIPGKGDSFDFDVVPPCGIEMLKLFASTKPLSHENGEILESGIKQLSIPLVALTESFRSTNTEESIDSVEQAEAFCVINTVKVNQGN
jgi:TolB-like protein